MSWVTIDEAERWNEIYEHWNQTFAKPVPIAAACDRVKAQQQRAPLGGMESSGA